MLFTSLPSLPSMDLSEIANNGPCCALPFSKPTLMQFFSCSGLKYVTKKPMLKMSWFDFRAVHDLLVMEIFLTSFAAYSIIVPAKRLINAKTETLAK